MTVEEARDGLRSENIDDLHSVLIDVGKQGRRELQGEVARCLAHEDPSVRRAAIRVLGFYWKLPAYREVAEALWRGDPDEEVRGIALMAWSAYYAGTRDPVVLRRLYDLLRDPAENEYLRAQAYPALFAVAGLPKQEWPRSLSIYGDIEGGADWALVERLMSGAASRA